MFCAEIPMNRRSHPITLQGPRMKNALSALSALLPLMLMCAGSVLLTAVAAWTADNSAMPRRVLPGAAAVTVASLTPSSIADAAQIGSGQGNAKEGSK